MLRTPKLLTISQTLDRVGPQDEPRVRFHNKNFDPTPWEPLHINLPTHRVYIDPSRIHSPYPERPPLLARGGPISGPYKVPTHAECERNKRELDALNGKFVEEPFKWDRIHDPDAPLTLKFRVIHDDNGHGVKFNREVIGYTSTKARAETIRAKLRTINLEGIHSLNAYITSLSGRLLQGVTTFTAQPTGRTIAGRWGFRGELAWEVRALSPVATGAGTSPGRLVLANRSESEAAYIVARLSGHLDDPAKRDLEQEYELLLAIEVME